MALHIESYVKPKQNNTHCIKLKCFRYEIFNNFTMTHNAFGSLISFIKGFIHRADPTCPESQMFIRQTRLNFLLRLKEKLPKSVLDKSWPMAPKLVAEVDIVLIIQFSNVIK